MKNIVSYGGGTQSTAMILMALEGKFGLKRPDFGVWADTGAEPEFIYSYVDYFVKYVKDHYNFEIYIIQHKQGLEHHVLSVPEKSRKGNFYNSSVPPFYTYNEDTKKVGMLMRQCTSDFKINPVTKFINSKLKRGEPYRMWIGISFDERSRMKISPIKRRKNYYPLVENYIRRNQSIDYVISLGLRAPQRSSCYFCPFHSDEYWQWLKDYHPGEFTKACDFEIKVQKNMKTKDTIFLHGECKPLSEIEFTNKNQLNMFPHLIDECDGECGI